MLTQINIEMTNSYFDENRIEIENHKMGRKHFEPETKHYHLSAKIHDLENHEKMFESTIRSHGDNCLANEREMENFKRQNLAH